MTSNILDWFHGLEWSRVEVRGIVFAALATLALIVALKLLAIFFRKLRTRGEARLMRQEEGLRVQQWEMLSAASVRRGGRYLLGLLHVLAAVLLIDVYVPLVLRLFPSTEPLSHRYFEFVIAPLVLFFRAFVAYLPNLVYISVVSALTFFLLKFLHLFFRALTIGSVELPGFYPDWAEPTYKLLRVLALAFLLIAVFPRLPGADEQAFKAVSLFAGALLTLGSTAAVGNAVAGVVLTYTRAFQVGDSIRVGETMGRVTKRTLLVTRLRTIANEQVTIPNGEVLRCHVVNYSPAAAEGSLGFTLSVRIGYDVEWRTVEELLLRATAAIPGITPEPPAAVFQTSFDDFGVSYVLRVFTSAVPPFGDLKTKLARNIMDEFNQAGVEILTPGVAVVRHADSGAAEVASGESPSSA